MTVTTDVRLCECGRRAILHRHTYCRACYERTRRNGQLTPVHNLTAEQRFFAKVAGEDPLGCWRWTGSHDVAGYGAFHLDSTTTRRAHRWAFELLRGEIPDGLVLDHLCRVPACVNPWHLDPVTNAENARRGAGTYRDGVCKRGHTMADAKRNPNGSRQCRTCLRAATRERSRRRRDSARGGPPAPMNSTKTHCPQGHPYQGANLIIGRRGNGRSFRQCRTCTDAARRKHRNDMHIDEYPATEPAVRTEEARRLGERE
jgi:hypothetical protein